MARQTNSCGDHSRIFKGVIKYEIEVKPDMLNNQSSKDSNAAAYRAYEHINANVRSIRWLSWRSEIGKQAKVEFVKECIEMFKNNDAAKAIFADYI